MSNVHDALRRLDSRLKDFGDAAQALRIDAGIVVDATVNDSEWAHLTPLAEQMMENILTSFSQFLDTIPPELGERRR